jgi:BirA family biotin operon repressor/biotin-[acetyl-CoA-carboxylase] ligase
MTFALGPRAAQAGYRLAGYDSIGSTNSEALHRIRSGERGPLWIAARAQTEGRGRRGRAWTTQDGNLAASLLIVVSVPLSTAATLGFVAGLALWRAIENCTQGLSIALKWPNDLLASNRKLAGILLESETIDGHAAVVIGIGVNVASAPSDLPFPATSLAALQQVTSAEHVFAELSDAWIEFHALWDNGRGLEAIRSRWLSRAAGLNKDISIRTGDTVLNGIFRTLDEQGRLVLQTADGTLVPVTAGDVYFGQAATNSVDARPL